MCSENPIPLPSNSTCVRVCMCDVYAYVCVCTLVCKRLPFWLPNYTVSGRKASESPTSPAPGPCSAPTSGEELRRGLHSERSWLVTCCLNVARLRGHSPQAGLRLLQTSSGRGSPSESWTWNGVGRWGAGGGCPQLQTQGPVCPGWTPTAIPPGAVLNPGVCPQGTPGSVRRHFWLSQLRGMVAYWHLEGGGQRRYPVSCTASDGPHHGE